VYGCMGVYAAQVFLQSRVLGGEEVEEVEKGEWREGDFQRKLFFNRMYWDEGEGEGERMESGQKRFSSG
jgi:hypothetical protein